MTSYIAGENQTNELMDELAQLRAVEAERDALRSALMAVSPFQLCDDPSGLYCIWCGNGKEVGHASDCRYATLAAPRDAGDATKEG